MGRGACPIFAAPKLTGPWTGVGDIANFSGGECPSLFPLPKLTPGTSVPPGDSLPSHVFKRGKCPDPQCQLNDKFMLGNFADGRALTDPLNATAGTFTATPGVPFPCKQEIDNGKTGKDRKVLVKNPCSGDGTNGHAPNGGDHIVDYGEYCKEGHKHAYNYYATAALYLCVLQPRSLAAAAHSWFRKVVCHCPFTRPVIDRFDATCG
eukprot:COSAG06_NODE_1899_length_8112_cov_7.981904_2_plen_207_part_00